MSDEPEPSTQAFPNPRPRMGNDEAEALFGLLSEPPQAPSQPLEVDDLRAAFPQYQILALIGRGGMGVVYKARHKALDRFVAIKLLPPELGGNADFVARFQREARAMARLEHPNIITVYDFGQTPSGQPYFVMEFIDGANLADLIHSGAFRGDGGQQGGAGAGGEGSSSGPVPKLDPLVVAAQLCEALAYAHGEGIVHRDIKPANVMIDRRGRVKVADFGLARIVAAEIDATALTTTGTVMGTLDYMAPEQRKGMQVDQRADIYSLGVMVYEMFCGEVPQGVFEPPSSKVKCDPRIDTIVATAMQSAPERRYQQTAEMKAAVDDLRTTSVIASRVAADDAAKSRMAKPPFAANSRRHAAFLVAALALMSLCTAAWWWMHRQTPPGFPAKHLATSVDQSTASTPAPIKLWGTREEVSPKPGQVAWEENALRLDGATQLYSARLSRNAIGRVSIRLNRAARSPQLAVRSVGGYGYLLGLTSESGPSARTIILQAAVEGAMKPLATWRLPRTYAEDDWIRLELRALEDELTIIADGQTIATVHDSSQPQAGGYALWATAAGYFRDIEYVPLDSPASASAASKQLQTEEIVQTPGANPSAIKLWDSQEKIPSGPGISWEDGALRIQNGQPEFRTPSSAEINSRDVIVRASVRMKPLPKDPALLARVTGSPANGYRINLDAEHRSCVLATVIAGRGKTLKVLPVPPDALRRDWLPMELRVTGNQLTAVIDGQVLGSVEDSSVPDSGRHGRVLVGAGDAYFRDIEYVPLDPTDPAQNPKAAEPAPIKLWDAPEKLPKLKGIGWENNAVRLDNNALHSTMPGQPAEKLISRDMIVRASIRMNSEAAGPNLDLRDTVGDQTFYRVTILPRGQRLGVGLDVVHDNKAAAQQWWPLPRAYGPEEWLRLEARAIGDQIVIAVDGATLAIVHDSSIPKVGGMMIHARGISYFREIEYVPLDGMPEAELQKLAASAAMPLWRTAESLPANSGFQWQDGILHGVKDAALKYTGSDSRDAIFRVSVRMNPESMPQISLRVANDPVTNKNNNYNSGLDIRGSKVWIGTVHNATESKRLGSWPLPRKYSPEEWLRWELRTKGNRVSVSIDGQQVGEVTDASQPQSGGAVVFSKTDGYFRDIEYVPLDRLAAIEPWHDYLAELRSGGALKDHPVLEDDGARIRVRGNYDLVLSHDPPARDAAVRAVCTGIGTGTSALKLRQQREADGTIVLDYAVHFDPGVVRLLIHHYAEKENVVLQEWNYPPGFDPAAEHAVELRAVHDWLTVRMDGQEIGSVRDKTIAQPGTAAIGLPADASLPEIKTLRLDSEAAAQPWHDWIAEMRKANRFGPSSGITDNGTSITMTAGQHVVLRPAEKVRNGVVRYTISGDRGGLMLRIVNDAAGQRVRDYEMTSAERGISIQVHEGPDNAGTWRHLRFMALPAGFKWEDRHTFEFRAVDDLLSVSLDGVELVSIHDSTISEPGLMGAWLRGDLVVHELKSLSLD